MSLWTAGSGMDLPGRGQVTAGGRKKSSHHRWQPAPVTQLAVTVRAPVDVPENALLVCGTEVTMPPRRSNPFPHLGSGRGFPLPTRLLQPQGQPDLAGQASNL